MLKKGFVVLHRKMVEWEWYKDTHTKTVFIHLLLTANYENKRFSGMTIKRGQRVASYRTLSEETGLSEKVIRTAIKHLIRTNELASRSTPRFTVFTVLNYDLYQDKGQTIGRTQGELRSNSGRTKGNNETKINNNNKDKQNIAALAAKNEKPPETQWDFPKEVDF